MSNILKKMLKKNDVWFIKLNNNLNLIEVKIIEVTIHTVALKINNKINSYKPIIRYKISDIEFVEKKEIKNE